MRVFAVLVGVLMAALLALGVVTAVFYVGSARVVEGYPDILFSLDFTVNNSSVWLSGYGLSVVVSGHRVDFKRLSYDLSLNTCLELNRTHTYLLKTVSLSTSSCSACVSIEEVKRKLTDLKVGNATSVALIITPSFNSIEIISDLTSGMLSREPIVSVSSWSPLLIKVPLNWVGGELQFKPSKVHVNGAPGISVEKTNQGDGEGIHYHVLAELSKKSSQPVNMVRYVPSEALEARHMITAALAPILAALAIASSVTVTAYLIKVKFKI